MSQQTVAVDFDGVIHSYTSGWTGYEPIDPPVPGARDGISRLRAAGYRVVVLSTRVATFDGRQATYEWLAKHDIEVDGVTHEKVKAVLYIDDRGYRFDGDWSRAVAFVAAGVDPWTKRRALTWEGEPQGEESRA